MYDSFQSHLSQQLRSIRESGLYKDERIITSPQHAHVSVGSRPDQREVINLCANNYLGLANHPEVREAALVALKTYGYGMASVRFICGTQTIHKQLETDLSTFLGMEDTILYTSCFDANTGLFETLLTAEDCIISDQLNHASIIDGIRLCKAKRLRYRNCDMEDLEGCLKQASDARYRMIATDGTFSMDGAVAKLDPICELAKRYDSLVMVDDSHAVGVLGERGRGSHEHAHVMGRVDIITGTLGKALGGANGGFTSARKEIVEILRQRSRPYLFSNTLAPSIVAASIKSLELLTRSSELQTKLRENTQYFRERMQALEFAIKPGVHPIIPIMLGDAVLAKKMAEYLLEKGVYVIGFSYPVVPRGEARIRVQISSAHSQADIDIAIKAFEEAKVEFGL